MVHLSRTVYYYKLKGRRKNDEQIAEVLGDWAIRFPQYGFWKLYHRLRLAGYKWNHKPVYRVYKALKLNIRKRPKRKIPDRPKRPLVLPKLPNLSWSIDFLSDSLADGQRFRCFCVMDDFNREILAIEVDTSLPSLRVIRVLSQLLELRGTPKQIRLDNGPEFLAEKMQDWAKAHQIELGFIQPGKPTQNAFVERFNGSLRRELLSRHWFTSIKQVRQFVQKWMMEYNHFRPHDGLKNLSPILFAKRMKPKIEILI